MSHPYTTLTSGVALVLSALCAGALVLGCVSEELGGGSPEIGLADILCSESTSSQFDGQIVSLIEVPVSDVDDDVARVTATVQGAVLTLEEDPERGGVYRYMQPTQSDSFIRCEEDLPITFRATDEAGNVEEVDVVVN